ncbi:unnamed protein product [Mytilus edulis]|uniref:Reverse transcriptase domain-containing protein n=1 Tax=Mytilus edulis TaxID=6550 RepID=A0A8S3VL08_MYTED|nr:unnamed protein product [Mytilus edulis]
MQIKDLQETLVNNLEKIDKLSYNFQIPNLADLAELIKIVLENNEFEFNGHIYKQIIGAPMGGILSPTCTDLHLASILKMILDKFQYRTHIKLHCQYRDDGFMVFTGNMLQIEEFFSIANKIDNLLKFTYEVSEELMTYLDLEVYKDFGIVSIAVPVTSAGYFAVNQHGRTAEKSGVPFSSSKRW